MLRSAFKSIPYPATEFPSPSSRYQPIARIAQGETAEIILAEMIVGREFERLVALKRIWPEVSRDEEFVARFLGEARRAARMNHPNIVQTVEVLAGGPRPSVAMEYLGGQSLARVLDRLGSANTMSWTLRLRVLADVLAAVDYAHARIGQAGDPEEAIHPDVNPQSVFITYDGRVKLTNPAAAPGSARRGQAPFHDVTGSLAYMAPERLFGRPSDRRADLFAVGVLLWELAAGRRLWSGIPVATVLRDLSAGVPIRPIPESQSLPSGLHAICSRAVAVDPARRYATAAELRADLQRLVSGRDDASLRHLSSVMSLAFGEEHAVHEELMAKYRGRTNTVVADISPPRDARKPRPIDARAPQPRHGEKQDERATCVDQAWEVSDAQIVVEAPTSAPESHPCSPAKESSLRGSRDVRDSRLAWGAAGFVTAVLLIVAAPAAVSRLRPRPAVAEAAKSAAPLARPTDRITSPAGENPSAIRDQIRSTTEREEHVGRTVAQIVAPARPRAVVTKLATPAKPDSAPEHGGSGRVPRRDRHQPRDKQDMERLWKWVRSQWSPPSPRLPPSAAERDSDDNVLEPSTDPAAARDLDL